MQFYSLSFRGQSVLTRLPVDGVERLPNHDDRQSVVFVLKLLFQKHRLYLAVWYVRGFSVNIVYRTFTCSRTIKIYAQNIYEYPATK